MNTYRNIAGYDPIIKVRDEASRLAIVAYDNLIVHQLDTDSIYIFNMITGQWELSAGPSTIVRLGMANGLTLNENILSLSLATPYNSGAMSSQDYLKLSSLYNKDFISEVFTLTQTNISESKLTLNHTPIDPEGLSFLPDGGILQRYGVDYTIVGNDIIWSGMGLDGFLEVNDIIRITY